MAAAASPWGCRGLFHTFESAAEQGQHTQGPISRQVVKRFVCGMDGFRYHRFDGL
jgi:hypothetical protein